MHFRYENESDQNGSASAESPGQRREQVMGGTRLWALMPLRDDMRSFMCSVFLHGKMAYSYSRQV